MFFNKLSIFVCPGISGYNISCILITKTLPIRSALCTPPCGTFFTFLLTSLPYKFSLGVLFDILFSSGIWTYFDVFFVLVSRYLQYPIYLSLKPSLSALFSVFLLKIPQLFSCFCQFKILSSYVCSPFHYLVFLRLNFQWFCYPGCPGYINRRLLCAIQYPTGAIIISLLPSLLLYFWVLFGIIFALFFLVFFGVLLMILMS